MGILGISISYTLPSSMVNHSSYHTYRIRLLKKPPQRRRVPVAAIGNRRRYSLPSAPIPRQRIKLAAAHLSKTSALVVSRRRDSVGDADGQRTGMCVDKHCWGCLHRPSGWFVLEVAVRVDGC
jgi:hypothetical protein